jgi:predicted membrane protein
METSTNNRSKKGVVTGIVIIGIGVLWLLNRMGLHLPHWLFEWHTIMLIIGVFIGISNNFKNPVSWILIGLGGFGLINEFLNIPFELRRYFWPIMVIGIGLIILIRPRLKKNNLEVDGAELGDSGSKLDSVSIFNGTKRYVTSKKFVGGETVSVFGGTEINLLNADFEGQITIENVVIFGGLKLIVPQNWEVNTNTTSIFGGVEDKRLSAVEIVSEDGKVLHLTGTVVFGGIDIVSY